MSDEASLMFALRHAEQLIDSGGMQIEDAVVLSADEHDLDATTLLGLLVEKMTMCRQARAALASPPMIQEGTPE